MLSSTAMRSCSSDSAIGDDRHAAVLVVLLAVALRPKLRVQQTHSQLARTNKQGCETHKAKVRPR